MGRKTDKETDKVAPANAEGQRPCPMTEFRHVHGKLAGGPRPASLLRPACVSHARGLNLVETGRVLDMGQVPDNQLHQSHGPDLASLG